MQDFEAISDTDLVPYIHTHIKNVLIQKRLCNLLNYYTKTATLCRKYYYVSAALTIVLPTFVTIMSSFSGVWDMHFINIFTAVIAGLSAIISGFTTLFKWQENWLRYRMGVEKLKKESIQYIAGVGNYQDINQKDAVFLQMMENIAEEMNVKDLLQYGKTQDLLVEQQSTLEKIEKENESLTE